MQNYSILAFAFDVLTLLVRYAAAAAKLSRSMMTLHYYWVVLCWGRCVRRWLCSQNWEAQILPKWGHCGPVFGFVAAVWRKARRSSEAASQSLTKCARPASQVAFYTTRSLARVSRSHGLMRHLRRFILMWSINRFFGRPTDRCPDESSP